MCDLWSNESVQNIRLLSGSAPEAYAESLVYDCRLMNVASARGQALALRDWLTESDENLSPQAVLLSPRATLRLAQAIIADVDPYRRTVAAAREAVAILEEAAAADRLPLPPREKQWLKRLGAGLEELPASGETLLRELCEQHGGLFDLASYGLE
jgi:methanol--5-hydroxybenzimidazolylcobamide Co-methyltransferase